jgi:hypothetical protein
MRLDTPRDTTEAGGWSAFDYAWKAFETTFAWLVPELDTAQTDQVRESINALISRTTHPLLVRAVRPYLKALVDAPDLDAIVVSDSKAGRTRFKVAVQRLRDSIRPDSFSVDAMASTIQGLRNARFHAKPFAASRIQAESETPLSAPKAAAELTYHLALLALAAANAPRSDGNALISARNSQEEKIKAQASRVLEQSWKTMKQYAKDKGWK